MAADDRIREALSALTDGLRDDMSRRMERASADVLAEARALTTAQSQGDTLWEALLSTTSKLAVASSLTDVLDIVRREAERLRPASILLVMRDGVLTPWSTVATTPGNVDSSERLPLTVGGQVVAELRMDRDPQRSRAIALDLVTRFAAQRLEVITARRSAELTAKAARESGAESGHDESSDDESSDDGSDNDAARRYARLLVSEIRLYHETAILEGRRSRDLGSRLAGEIARARSLYNQRVGESRHLGQYFRDELIRTLADGDPSII